MLGLATALTAATRLAAASAVGLGAGLTAGLAELATPSGARAAIERGYVTLTWDAVPGALFYRVARSSSLEPAAKTVVTGLTTSKFSEPAPERGELATYQIVAVSKSGVSEASDPVKLAPRKATPVEP